MIELKTLGLKALMEISDAANKILKAHIKEFKKEVADRIAA